MNYKEALDYISNSHKFGIRLGLDNIKKLLDLLGNPQENLKIVHVAGTNGKGSTCSFISSILQEFDYKVGLYTSPFLEVFNERIRINNENISNEDIGRIISIIKEKIEIMENEGFDYPTEFEIVTAMAFYYYFEQKVDFVVLEVGLGGKYDATNVINKSEVSVITPISIDHINVLGDTIPNIASEKAGIIKENSVVFVYNQSDEAKDVIKKVCDDKNSKLYEVLFDDIKIKNSDINYQEFDYKNYENLKINLIGEHQIKNSILAINVVEFLLNKNNKTLDKDKLKRGLLNTKWAGRIEKIKENPLFIIDGAHNEDGAKSLSKVLDKNFKNKNLTLLIGMLEDKEIDKVLDIIMPYFNKVITTNVNNQRTISSDKLKEKISDYVNEVYSIKNLEEALDFTLKISNKDDIIISCGSLYLIGEVRTLINKK